MSVFHFELISFVTARDFVSESDFGTRIKFKCHQPIKRKGQTLEGDLCANWKLIDSFGVRLDFEDSINHTNSYKNFYDDPSGYGPYQYGDGWEYFGKGL